MTETPRIVLQTALNRFIDGGDCSLDAANRLEVLLEDSYPDDEVVQDRVDDLARYRPGGGAFLLDEDEMRARLRRLRTYLSTTS